jgi:hypothetical protein
VPSFLQIPEGQGLVESLQGAQLPVARLQMAFGHWESLVQATHSPLSQTGVVPEQSEALQGPQAPLDKQMFPEGQLKLGMVAQETHSPSKHS